MNFGVFALNDDTVVSREQPKTSINDHKMEEENRLLKGAMYTQFVKSSEEVSQKNCWETKESASLEPLPSQTVQLLDVFVDQKFSLENVGDVGMQLRDFVLHFAERIPIVKRVCAVTRTRGFREVQRKAKIAGTKIPTHEEHVLSKEGGNGLGVYFHVGAGAKVLKVQRGWRPKDDENDGTGTLIEYDVENISWRRYSNVHSYSFPKSSNRSIVESVANASISCSVTMSEEDE